MAANASSKDNKKRNKKVLLSHLLLFSMMSAVVQAQTVTDIEGNVYNTVTIGKQVWMAENLKTTRLNDNTEIPLHSDNKDWKALFSPAYFWYDNEEEANKNTYGALYNWYSVNTHKLCPAGWHIPDDREWITYKKDLNEAK
jgi:uncharacterized protein (TIGR02145 family)